MIKFTRDMLRTAAAPCSRHAEHISRRMDGHLSAGERAGLWVHLRGCSACRAFARQLEKLRALARTESPAHTAPQDMPADVRERLSTTLVKEAHDQPGTQ